MVPKIKIHAIDVPLQVWEDGSVRVRGTRIPLERIVTEYYLGASPECIHDAFDTVSVPDVYAVLAYYLQRRDEVDEYIRAREEEAERVRAEVQARWPTEGLREKLLARRAQQQASEPGDPPGR